MSEVARSSRAVGSMLGWRNGRAASSKDDGRKACGFDSHPEHSFPRGVTAAHLPSKQRVTVQVCSGNPCRCGTCGSCACFVIRKQRVRLSPSAPCRRGFSGYSVRIVGGNSSVRVRPPAPFRVGLTVGQKPLKLFVEVQILDPEPCLRRLTVWHPPFKRI